MANESKVWNKDLMEAARVRVCGVISVPHFFLRVLRFWCGLLIGKCCSSAQLLGFSHGFIVLVLLYYYFYCTVLLFSCVSKRYSYLTTFSERTHIF